MKTLASQAYHHPLHHYLLHSTTYILSSTHPNPPKLQHHHNTPWKSDLEADVCPCRTYKEERRKGRISAYLPRCWEFLLKLLACTHAPIVACFVATIAVVCCCCRLNCLIDSQRRSRGRDKEGVDCSFSSIRTRTASVVGPNRGRRWRSPLGVDWSHNIRGLARLKSERKQKGKKNKGGSVKLQTIWIGLGLGSGWCWAQCHPEIGRGSLSWVLSDCR